MTTAPFSFLLSIFLAFLHLCEEIRAFTLITFDVDGTLVQGSGNAADTSAHARAFSHAVGRVLGDGDAVTPVAQALERTDFHGSTDGLILLRLARATLGIDAKESSPRLDEMMAAMYEHMNAMQDAEVALGLSPLPGVIERLDHLEGRRRGDDRVVCGLVTGNVEGIARRKMQALGIYQTGALHPPHREQLARDWKDTDAVGFLGGFGSDYCSNNIEDFDRNHLDRAEQIAIAVRRASELYPDEKLRRVVHVGDAPADVLAAKACAEESILGHLPDLCVGMVAVATGSYTGEELRELAGDCKPGRWEPVVLEDGMADENFISACGL